MASTYPKIRFVYCPKCWQLLIVTTNEPLYKCGECDTILESRRHGGSCRLRCAADENGHVRNNELEQADTNSGKQILHTDANCSSDPVSSVDCGNNAPEYMSNSSHISTSAELDTYSARAETGAESEFDPVNGRLSKEVLATDIKLSSKGNQSNAVPSASEHRYPLKAVADSEDIGQQLETHQVEDFPPKPDGSKPKILLESKRNADVSVSESDEKKEKKADKLLLNEQAEKSQIHCSNCTASDATETTKCRSPNEILSNSPSEKSPRTASERSLFEGQSTQDSLNQKPWPVLEIDSETQSEARKFQLKSSSNENIDSIDSQSQEKCNLEEPDIFHSARSCIESEMDIDRTSLSQDDLSCRKKLSVHLSRNGSLSSYGRDELSCSAGPSSSSASSTIQTLAEDKMGQLKKVEVLRDQLQRLCGPDEKVKEPLRSRISSRCSSPSQQIRWKNGATPWNPRNTVPYYQYGYPEFSSSSQVSNSICQVGDHSWQHSCPQDCPHPLQMAAPNLPCACTGHVYHHICPSGASHRRQHPLEYPAFPLTFGKRVKGKQHQRAKRSCRPTAGGAPFVLCYECQKLLQLPADFLLPEKGKRRELQCGACSKVLIFYLHPRSRSQQLPVKADQCLGSSSSAHDDGRLLQGQSAVSYSDDCWNLAWRSSSTEGDPSVFETPAAFPRALGKADHSTSIKRPSETEKSTAEAASAGKMPLNLKISPLHQLMSYASLSQLSKLL